MSILEVIQHTRQVEQMQQAKSVYEDAIQKLDKPFVRNSPTCVGGYSHHLGDGFFGLINIPMSGLIKEIHVFNPSKGKKLLLVFELVDALGATTIIRRMTTTNFSKYVVNSLSSGGGLILKINASFELAQNETERTYPEYICTGVVVVPSQQFINQATAESLEEY